MTRTAAEPRSIAGAASTLLVTSRPRFWLYLAGPALVGIAFGGSTLGDLVSPVALALFAYFLLPAPPLSLPPHLPSLPQPP